MVKSPSSRYKRMVRRIPGIFLRVIIIFLFLVVILLILLQTSSVQNFGRKKIQAYLESKLHVKVIIGELSIDFPKNIVLKNIYLEDQYRDTLLSAGNINLDVNLWGLFNHKVVLNDINLDHWTVNIDRLLPDSDFNYAFIARAFASKNVNQEKAAEGNSQWTFELGKIHLVNIHAHYKDDATGNAANLFLSDLQTRIKTFDPDKLIFEIPEFSMHGLNGYVRLYTPTLALRQKEIQKPPSTANRQPPTANYQPIHLQLGKIALDSIVLAYSDELNNTKAKVGIGLLSMLADSIDLNKMQFDLKSVDLNRSTFQLVHGKSVVQQDKKDTTGKQSRWMVNLAYLNLVNDQFSFDDDAKKPIANAMDYAHLLIRNLNTTISGLSLSSENYKGEIKMLSFSEKSGFELKRLSTGFYYSDHQASVNNLILLTNNTNLRNKTIFKYASVASLLDKPGDLTADLAFDHSYIGMKDLLLLFPSLRSTFDKEQNARIRINGQINGQLNNLDIPDLALAGLQHTQMEFSGQIKGLPDTKKAIYHLQIKNLTTVEQDIYSFLPEKIIPKNLRIPDSLSAHGRFDGNMDQFNVDMALNSSFGGARIKGQLNIPKKQYDLNADLAGFDLGKLLNQDSLLGKVDLHAMAKGNGFDFKKMQTVAHFQIPAAMVKGYHYRNLSMDISMQDGMYHINSIFNDQNVKGHFDAKGIWVEKFPSLLLELKMDTINLQALHLMKDSLAMSFNLNTNLTCTDPDAVEGKLYLTALGLSYRNQHLSTDSIYLEAAKKDSIQSLLLHSEMADLNLSGKYKFKEIKQALKQTINHYYKIPGFIEERISPQNWQMSLSLRPSPDLLVFDPTLSGSDTIQLNMGFNSLENDFHFSLLAPSIQFDKQFIHQLSATAGTNDSALRYAVQFGSAHWAGLDLFSSGIFGRLTNNQFRNSILLGDAKNKARYRLSTLLTGMPDGWKLSLLPDSLLLNYDTWNTSGDNFIQYDSSGLFVNHLLIEHENQSLLINSSSSSPQSPIDVSFNHFRIKTLSSFAGQDSLLLDGELNGQTDLRDILSNPSFTSNIKIDNLAYNKDTLGNISIVVDNQQPNIFSTNLSIEGKDNDAKVSGMYNSKDKRIDMQLDIGKLDLSMVKPFSAGEIRNIRGWLKGNLHATGSFDQPVLTGSVRFDSAYITPFLSGERLKLSSDSIQFNHEGISLNKFTFLDSAGDKAILDGHLYTKDYKHYRFDLAFNADDFILVNTPIETNRIFYGKLNMDIGLQIKGDIATPVVTGHLHVNKQTDFTLILPNSDPEVVSRQGVVLFADKDHPVDTARIRTYLDSLSRNAGFKGIDAFANIETDSSAKFNLIINERTGDALSVRGRASLAGAMNKNGKLSLTGNYVLDDGAYNLSLRLLKRKFNLQRGSTITWTGDPTGATIDITATYLCTTAPISLVGNQMSGMSQEEINRFNQKLPFMVNLKMRGLLLKPEISFSITLPPNESALWQNVDSKLAELNSNASELNKQVFALLLFNSFISENPFENTSGGNSGAALMASQSASNLLTSQLNELAGGFGKRVDLSLNVNTNQSYNTSGQAINQTALQVGVSKNLFGDRVKVSVGSDFQLSGASQGPNASNIAGNAKIDYTLTPDGKYIIRVYSVNQYNTVVEGQVVETGVSFIITLDFDTFNELFQKKYSLKEKSIPDQKEQPAKTNPNLP
jgi:translocation and assembly module TamB